MFEKPDPHSEHLKLPGHFTAIVAKGDNWYVAHCPELGVVSQGKTETEARENLQEAVEFYLKRIEDDHWEDGRYHEAC